MAEELKNLIERIHEDAVAKAQRDAEAILQKARDEAEAIRKDARAEAAATLKKAEADSTVFAERGRKAVEQAARDVIIAVGQSVTRTIEALAEERVKAEMDPEFVRKMITHVVTAYCTKEGKCDEIDLLVSEQDQKAVVQFFMQEFRDAIHKGIDIHPAGDIASGFRMIVDREHVQHDFTGDAIATAISKLLRPHLAEIVKAASAQATT